MRIADLMIDAKVIAESDASPIHFDDTNNVFIYERKQERAAGGEGGSNTTGASAAAAALAAQAARNQAETELVDDPVEAAMRAATGHAQGSKDDAGVDVDSVEQSLRNVQVQDNGAAAATSADARATNDFLVPSQVRAKKYQNKDELARALFAAYPIDSPSQQASSSHTLTSANGAGNAQQQQGGPTSGLDSNLLLSNGAPISSIWAPNASDMAAPANHLQSYAGHVDAATLDLYRRQLQQQQHLGSSPYQQQPWSMQSYAQHMGGGNGVGGYAETYGNTTPDPFNPHGYGGVAAQMQQHLHHAQHQQGLPYVGSPLQHQHQQQQGQQRTTPQPVMCTVSIKVVMVVYRVALRCKIRTILALVMAVDVLSRSQPQCHCPSMLCL